MHIVTAVHIVCTPCLISRMREVVYIFVVFDAAMFINASQKGSHSDCGLICTILATREMWTTCYRQ